MYVFDNSSPNFHLTGWTLIVAGWTSSTTSSKKILKTLFTNTMTTKATWLGKGDKLALNSLRIGGILKGKWVFIYLFIYSLIHLFVHLFCFVCMFDYQCCLFIYLFINLFIYYLFIYLNGYGNGIMCWFRHNFSSNREIHYPFFFQKKIFRLTSKEKCCM